MKHACLRCHRILLLVTVSVLVAGAAWAQDEARLIQLRDLTPAKAASTLEAWDVDVDPAVLDRRSPVLTVDLPDGRLHRIEGSKVEVRGPGDLVWRGRFEDAGAAILTLKNGFVVGLLFAPDALYELAATGRGQVLNRLDPEAFDPCAHEDGASRFDPGLLIGAKSGFAVEGLDLTPKADFNNVDIMTVYTAAARIGAGGTAQIEATAQSAIDISNTALANSDAATRFTLVHTAEVSYVETGNIGAARNWVRNDPTVNELRDQHAADLVGMLVENGGGFCGIAFLMGNEDPVAFAPNGYQVTARVCAVGNLTYAHEHGHNMGLQHNPENGAPPSQAIFPWSYGHYYNGHYRTVMSYSNPCPAGCVRRPYFSNPDVFFQGLATGIANERDNARTIRLIAPITSQYRVRICDGPDCRD